MSTSRRSTPAAPAKPSAAKPAPRRRTRRPPTEAALAPTAAAAAVAQEEAERWAQAHPPAPVPPMGVSPAALGVSAAAAVAGEEVDQRLHLRELRPVQDVTTLRLRFDQPRLRQVLEVEGQGRRRHAEPVAEVAGERAFGPQFDQVPEDRKAGAVGQCSQGSDRVLDVHFSIMLELSNSGNHRWRAAPWASLGVAGRRDCLPAVAGPVPRRPGRRRAVALASAQRP